ncbi:hypothetical protein T459_28968 [Capsicum annuum]|uniref:WW domain-containing protein n=1 Tax=Capsicum annuum TaxID=4072 RepID=A0A2G2YIR6_CAPAN|nr:hypothetical protein FXO37_21152 [Capsicum annuum]PHT69481.1 hypothetical protein T459_28968 [Capsicum annuum]
MVRNACHGQGPGSGRDNMVSKHGSGSQVEKPPIPPLAGPALGTIPSMSLYYYNRRTRISTWEKPRELMTEMELALEKDTILHASDFGSISIVKTSSPGADGSLVSAQGDKSIPTVVLPAANLPTIMASESSSLSGKVSCPMIETVEMKNSSEPASPAVANSEKIGIVVTLENFVAPPISETTTTQDAIVYGDGFCL